MKRGIMIWVISAIVYLGIVITGYSVYASMNSNPVHPQVEKSVYQSMNHGEHAGHGANGMGDVTPQVSYENGVITIEIKDKRDQVPELEVSHEKLMHVIVVRSDLRKYYHFHPKKENDGVYSQKLNLADNSYKVFVDIKPKGLHYSVEPIELQVGETNREHRDNSLVADTDFTKTINGQRVELTTRSFKIDKEIALNFDVKDAKPEPYLGASGHVVILDEDGERFIHVHPVSEDKTVFETQFNKPGMYKLWAEFKFGDRVNAYPFVIEVKP